MRFVKSKNRAIQKILGNSFQDTVFWCNLKLAQQRGLHFFFFHLVQVFDNRYRFPVVGIIFEYRYRFGLRWNYFSLQIQILTFLELIL